MTPISTILLISLIISFVANLTLVSKLREAYRKMEVYEHGRKW